MELARKADSIWVTKGKKLLRFEWSDNPTEDEIASVILGRSGTLRAPAILAGSVFMVGFSDDAYTALFG